MKRLILILAFLCIGSIQAPAQNATTPSRSIPLAPPTQLGKPSASALLAAAFSGQTRRVKELLATGISPDARDAAGGWTPLMMASVGDFQATVKVLLDAGANPNPYRFDGATALMIASLQGAYHVAAMLAGRSNLNAQDNAGNTALAYAALNGRAEIVANLIKAGANPEIVDSDGQTPLHHAVHEERSEAVEALINAKVNLNRRDNQGQTPLFVAAANGYDELVRRLLNAGANPGITDRTGRTPLMWSVLLNDEKAVAALLGHGVSIDQRAGSFDRNVTALILAAWTGKDAIVKLLLERHADPNVLDDDGETALHWAAANDQVGAIQLLLASSANPNIRNKSGQTALDVALYENRAEAVRILTTP